MLAEKEKECRTIREKVEEEKQELKGTINYYIDLCAQLGEEVIQLRTKLDKFSQSPKGDFI